MKCTKICFNTPDEAREELFRIVEQKEHKTWKERKPCRYYKCPNGDHYHLTSQLHYEY